MKILVLDIAASKTGARSVLEDFYKYVVGMGASVQDGKTSSETEDSRYALESNDIDWIFVTGVPGILEPVSESGVEVIVRDDVKASWKERLRFEFFTGGRWINEMAPDIVFSLENMIPRGVVKGIRQVLYIHQPVGFQKIKKFSILKPEEREQGIYQKFYHPLILSSAKRADTSVVQTEWMRQALIEQTGMDEGRVYKVKPDIPDFSDFVKPGEFDSNRFFFPASDLPYKNHAVIEEARALLSEQGYHPEVMYTKEKVYPREQVLAEYNRSTLVFPSYLETFGMPLGEAQQFGNPMLVADTVFAREILKDNENVYYFDPFDAQRLATLMKKVMDGHIVPGIPHRPDNTQNSYAGLVDIILNG
ncbi:MAG: glycosyltransferase [Lachnospiraceae bacterium]|nr:glycosyltransferase [Lachnospiraceae bacterium]